MSFNGEISASLCIVDIHVHIFKEKQVLILDV